MKYDSRVAKIKETNRINIIANLKVDKWEVRLSLLLGACREVLGEVSCESVCGTDILAIA